MNLTESQIDQCLQVLEAAHGLDPNDDRYLRLEQAVAHLVKTAKKKRRLLRKKKKQAEDRALLARTGLAQKRFGATPELEGTLHHQRHCYVCRNTYKTPHDYFHMMCRACGDLCLAKREEPIDLENRRVLLTGGRIKIGYATALRLLRAGAEVHLTTRYPADGARRFAAEPDFAQWKDRLEIYGLDFRRLSQLYRMIEQWSKGPSFDILINNAAQTVRQSDANARALLEREEQQALPCRIHGEAAPFFAKLLDLGSERLAKEDPTSNAWTQHLDEVAPLEMIETQVVNVMAPFLLCSLMKKNLAASPHPDRFIINVAALEGRFSPTSSPNGKPTRPSGRHPHTNIAKAALNMLTRTSAQEYAEDGIYMVSVDPGWMSDELPEARQRQREAYEAHPPLEAEDCAARILDPIALGLQGQPVFGILLKDFRVSPW